MDIITNLQNYKQELCDQCNSLQDFHDASKISHVIDKVDLLINEIVYFQDIIILKK